MSTIVITDLPRPTEVENDGSGVTLYFDEPVGPELEARLREAFEWFDLRFYDNGVRLRPRSGAVTRVRCWHEIGKSLETIFDDGSGHGPSVRFEFRGPP